MVREQSPNSACERFRPSHHRLCRLLVQSDLGTAPQSDECRTRLHLGLQKLDHAAVSQHSIFVALDQLCKVLLCRGKSCFELLAAHLCCVEKDFLRQAIVADEAKHTHARSEPDILQLFLLDDSFKLDSIVPAVLVADTKDVCHQVLAHKSAVDDVGLTVEQDSVRRNVDDSTKLINILHTLGHCIQSAKGKFFSEVGKMAQDFILAIQLKPC